MRSLYVSLFHKTSKLTNKTTYVPLASCRVIRRLRRAFCDNSSAGWMMLAKNADVVDVLSLLDRKRREEQACFSSQSLVGQSGILRPGWDVLVVYKVYKASGVVEVASGAVQKQ